MASVLVTLVHSQALHGLDLQDDSGYRFRSMTTGGDERALLLDRLVQSFQFIG
jgi:hypothetical protein